MKKHILYILVFAMVLTISCKKGTTPAPSANNLAGKWYYSADTLKEYKNHQLVSTDNTGGITIGQSSYFNFNANGTGSQVLGTATTNFNYTVAGNICTINTPAQTVDGFPIQASIEKATIKMQTSNQLILYFDDTSTATNGDVIEDTEAAYFTK